MESVDNNLPITIDEALGMVARMSQKSIIEAFDSVEQTDASTTHTFLNGLYIRQLEAKAGAIVIGHKQRFDHTNLFLKGKIKLLDNGEWKVLEAPKYFVGTPGRKIAYVLEDMVWINIHATNLQNINDIEDYLYDNSNVPEISKEDTEVELDKESFNKATERLGFTPEQLCEISQIDDVVDLPNGNYKFKLDKSPIHGQGVFATADMVAGEYIGPVKLGPYRTVLGRYTNHGHRPNAEFRLIGNNVCLFALEAINGCKGRINGDEIKVNYESAYNISRG